MTDICDDKRKIKAAVLDADLAVGEAVAWNVGPVGRLKLPSVGTRFALLKSGRNNRPVGATVDEPSGVVIRIENVEKVVAAFEIAGECGIYLGPALPFPEGRFS